MQKYPLNLIIATGWCDTECMSPQEGLLSHSAGLIELKTNTKTKLQMGTLISIFNKVTRWYTKNSIGIVLSFSSLYTALKLKKLWWNYSLCCTLVSLPLLLIYSSINVMLLFVDPQFQICQICTENKGDLWFYCGHFRSKNRARLKEV